jgi:ABC-type transport system involved in multi-copper enzyme maturation permease subunit
VPIHDQSYRRYRGHRRPQGEAWTVIARTGIRLMLKRRGFVALMLVSWLPFIIRAVQIYASTNMPQLAFIAPTAETFRQFLDQQAIFMFFVTVYAGAGLIANDRRANALQIYLSKPLGRAEYIGGKLAVLMTFLLIITWVPAMALLLVQIAFSGSLAFLRDNVMLVPAITLLSFLESAIAGAAMLALSSLSNNSRFVGILFAAVVFFTDALYGVLRAITRDTTVSWISFGNDVQQLGDAIFRLPLRYATPLPLSLGMLVALAVVSIVVLERRVRGVEVVV